MTQVAGPVLTRIKSSLASGSLWLFWRRSFIRITFALLLRLSVLIPLVIILRPHRVPTLRRLFYPATIRRKNRAMMICKNAQFPECLANRAWEGFTRAQPAWRLT